MDSGIVDSRGSAEGIDGSLSSLVVFPFDHLINISELVVNLLEYDFILVVKYSFILLHLDVHMLDSFQLLFQHSHIVLIVTSYIRY